MKLSVLKQEDNSSNLFIKRYALIKPMRLAHRIFLTIGSHKAGTNFVFQGKNF